MKPSAPSQDLYYELTKFFLPDDLLDYFDVVKFEEVDTGKFLFGDFPDKELHIHLDEKPWDPSAGSKPNGFAEATILLDFPIRYRKAVLHMRRRRYINAEGHNEVLDYGELLGAAGTQYCRELADFLK